MRDALNKYFLDIFGAKAADFHENIEEMYLNHVYAIAIFLFYFSKIHCAYLDGNLTFFSIEWRKTSMC